MCFHFAYMFLSKPWLHLLIRDCIPVEIMFPIKSRFINSAITNNRQKRELVKISLKVLRVLDGSSELLGPRCGASAFL